MPLQPKISKTNLQLRIANKQRSIPPPDNKDDSYNLDGFKYKPGKYDDWFVFAHDVEPLPSETTNQTPLLFYVTWRGLNFLTLGNNETPPLPTCSINAPLLMIIPILAALLIPLK
jgi:hypothetical protein